MNILPRYSIPHDINYCLDTMMEYHSFTPDIEVWLRLFNPDIVESFDSNINGSWIEKKVLEYKYWTNNANPEYVSLCYLLGSYNSPSYEKYIRDLVIPCIDNQCYLEMGAVTNKKYITYSCKEYSIYNIKSQIEDNIKLFILVKNMFNKTRELLSNPIKYNFKFEDIKEIRISDLEYYDYYDTIGIRQGYNKYARKAIKKSSLLLDSITNDNTSSKINKGDIVEFKGDKYIFRLKKSSNHLHISHGSVNTEVFDTNYNRIAKLCVYTPDVTCFDHVASLYIHVKSGMEEDIINKSNIITCYNKDLLPSISKEEYNRRNNKDFLKDILITDNKKYKKTYNKLYSKVIYKFNKHFSYLVPPKVDKNLIANIINSQNIGIIL